MTQYQQPPQPAKKHTTRNVLLILLAVAVLAYPALHVAMLAYWGVAEVVDSQRRYDVVYKVTGSAGSADLRYSKDGSVTDTELDDERLPWESETLKVKGGSPLFSISADRDYGVQGTIHCEIWVNGALVDSETDTAGLLAHCMHVP